MKFFALLLLCGIACAQTQVIPLPVTPAPIAPPAVQPPLVQPAAVTSPPLTLTATSTTCTVTGGAQTVTIAVPATPVTPPVTPPVVPPVAPTAVVYNNGTINWTFNMSYGATVNYQDTVGTPGGIDAAIMVTGGSGGGWQPGFSIPCQNGGTNCFDTSPYTYFVFSYKPTTANTAFLMAWHKPGDVANGNPGLAIMQYCSAPVVGTWGNCKVPLSAFAFSTTLVSKFTIQNNSPTVWYAQAVGFQ